MIWVFNGHTNDHVDFVVPRLDSDQPGICPVRSESLLSAWTSLGSLATHWAYSEDWSDCMDGHADLSLCWVHRSFCWFCHALAHLFMLFLQFSATVEIVDQLKGFNGLSMLRSELHTHHLYCLKELWLNLVLQCSFFKCKIGKSSLKTSHIWCLTIGLSVSYFTLRFSMPHTNEL